MTPKTENEICECILPNGKCTNKAKYKVRLRGNVNDKWFNVCENCISVYKYVQGREYGNIKSGFTIKKFVPKNQSNNSQDKSQVGEGDSIKRINSKVMSEPLAENKSNNQQNREVVKPSFSKPSGTDIAGSNPASADGKTELEDNPTKTFETCSVPNHSHLRKQGETSAVDSDVSNGVLDKSGETDTNVPNQEAILKEVMNKWNNIMFSSKDTDEAHIKIINLTIFLTREAERKSKDELNKCFLKHIKAQSIDELKNAIRDIISRYGRTQNMGGYSLDFLTEQMYIYFYTMFCELRKDFDKTEDLKQQLKAQNEKILEMIDNCVIQGDCGDCDDGVLICREALKTKIENHSPQEVSNKGEKK